MQLSRTRISFPSFAGTYLISGPDLVSEDMVCLNLSQLSRLEEDGFNVFPCAIAQVFLHDECIWH